MSNSILPAVHNIDFAVSPKRIKIDRFQGLLHYRHAWYKSAKVNGSDHMMILGDPLIMPLYVRAGESAAASMLTLMPGEILRLDPNDVRSIELTWPDPLYTLYIDSNNRRLGVGAITDQYKNWGEVVHTSPENYELRR